MTRSRLGALVFVLVGLCTCSVFPESSKLKAQEVRYEEVRLYEEEAAPPNGKLMVCYYGHSTRLPATKIPADICTHILFSFGEVTPTGIKPRQASDIQYYKDLVALKKQNPSLKVMISLQQGFPFVVDGTEDEIKRFVALSMQFLKEYGFDGVDLDWEFPQAYEKKNFTAFIKILSSYLKKEDMLLSAAIPNNPSLWRRGYDIDTFATYMDFMTPMTYDFHAYTANHDNTTGYNSPLYSPKGESSLSSTAGIMQYYMDAGLPASKLTMGLPLYGHSWTLASAENHGLHAPAVGRGAPGPYANLTGIYLYPDVCVALQRGATKVQDTKNGAAYLYHNVTWVPYDNAETIKQKVAYVKAQGFAGVGIWAMTLDDTSGVCKEGPLPLLNAIKHGLSSSGNALRWETESAFEIDMAMNIQNP